MQEVYEWMIEHAWPIAGGSLLFVAIAAAVVVLGKHNFGKHEDKNPRG